MSEKITYLTALNEVKEGRQERILWDKAIKLSLGDKALAEDVYIALKLKSEYSNKTAKKKSTKKKATKKKNSKKKVSKKKVSKKKVSKKKVSKKKVSKKKVSKKKVSKKKVSKKKVSKKKVSKKKVSKKKVSKKKVSKKKTVQQKQPKRRLENKKKSSISESNQIGDFVHDFPLTASALNRLLSGHSFGELILKLSDGMTADTCMYAIQGLVGMLPNYLQMEVGDFIDEFGKLGGHRQFWKNDAKETFRNYTNIMMNDLGLDYINITESIILFHILIMNFVYTINKEPRSRSFIMSSLGHGFFKRIFG